MLGNSNPAKERQRERERESVHPFPKVVKGMLPKVAKGSRHADADH